jgi:tetratricopeptide (TPR) repeat protein
MGARERSIRELAEEIRGLMASDLGQAARAAKRAAKAWPDSPALASLRAEILVRRGQYDEAAAALDAAPAFPDPDIKSRLRLVEAAVALGRFGQALEQIEAALRTRPAQEHVLRLAASLIDIGEHALALDTLARVEAEALLGMRAELQAVARRGAAADAAAGIEPAGKRLWSLAMDWLRQGRPDQARGGFEEVARRWPAYLPARIGLEGALEAQGRAPAAGAGRRLSPRGLLFDPRETFPLRPRAETLARVDAPEALQAAENAWLPLDPGGQAVRHVPAFAFDRLHPEPVEVSSLAPETFVASLRNPMLVGRGVPVCEDGALVRELTYINPDKFEAGYAPGGCRFDRARFRDGLCDIRCFDEPALLLAGPTDRSFGDWIINFPPRLALAEAARLDCRIVIAEGATAPAEPMLEALGVDPGRLLRHDPTGVSVFPKLFVPSWPMMERLNHMAEPFAIYRRAARPPPAHRPRLYLSREGIGGRPMLNEPQVRALFERHGFVAVRPERLSLDQARELFAGPACVAAPYGSALLNLVFATTRPACLVIAAPAPELFLREAISWLGAMDLPFGYVRGEPAPDPARQDAWIAPMELVEQGLEALLALADGGSAGL